jgi:hypothetical protein
LRATKAEKELGENLISSNEELIYIYIYIYMECLFEQAEHFNKFVINTNAYHYRKAQSIISPNIQIIINHAPHRPTDTQNEE